MWREHTLLTSDLPLAWYEAGSGAAVLFISGGPGDDHRYLRPVAQVLVPHFRCVLYDQRGTGASVLGRLDADTLNVNRFLEDIDRLRAELGTLRLRLVGHSWGATLALLYSARYPQQVERVALVGLGPLSTEFADVARANVLRPLSTAEREAFAALTARRRIALETGDLEAAAQAHIEQVTKFGVRSALYSAEAAAKFEEQFRATYSHNPLVNRQVMSSVDFPRLWAELDRVTARLLVLYGHQDFEPVVQAYVLRQHLPNTRISLLNECGHVPWLEQPEAFYRELLGFLSG
jgi:proline iminopeptidase